MMANLSSPPAAPDPQEIAAAFAGQSPYIKRDELESYLKAQGYVRQMDVQNMVNFALNNMMQRFILPMDQKLTALAEPLDETERIRRALFGTGAEET